MPKYFWNPEFAIVNSSEGEQILDILEEFQQEFSPWDDFDRQVVLESLENTVFNGKGFAAVSIEDDLITGVILATKIQSLFSKLTQTQELAFYVRPAFRKSKTAKYLLDMYLRWAEDIAKADYICLTLMDERVGKLYERKGFVKAETAYIKKVS